MELNEVDLILQQILNKVKQGKLTKEEALECIRQDYGALKKHQNHLKEISSFPQSSLVTTAITPKKEHGLLCAIMG